MALGENSFERTLNELFGEGTIFGNASRVGCSSWAQVLIPSCRVSTPNSVFSVTLVASERDAPCVVIFNTYLPQNNFAPTPLILTPLCEQPPGVLQGPGCAALLPVDLLI